MNILEQGRAALRALLALGGRRLSILAAVGVTITALVTFSGYMLSRPQYEVLYAGLDAQDAARVVNAIRDANVGFDVSIDGATVFVENGRAAQARMMLAERGLPRSAGAGYELYDKLGSLGLTSFMQETTRVRALEGELARSIQTMQGVRAARVHLVLPEEGTFRRRSQAGSASVVVRLATVEERRIADAIRHLVAAATPGLTLASVTVLDTDGSVLASGDDAGNMAGSASTVEKLAAERLQNNVKRTLAPILGARGLQVSVVAKFNMDKRETRETTYNPDGRVERSIRVTKENGSSRNGTSGGPTTVERNIPGEKPRGDGKESSEDNQKKEEITNYEVSSRSVETASVGGAIDRLNVALVIDRKSLLATMEPQADGAKISARIAELTELAGSAVGLQQARGDTIRVVVSDFVSGGPDGDTGGASWLVQALLGQIGAVAKAMAAVGMVAIIVLLGVRPVVRALGSAEAVRPDMNDAPLKLSAEAPSTPAIGAIGVGGPPQPVSGARASKQRLERLVASDEALATAILQQWIRG